MSGEGDELLAINNVNGVAAIFAEPVGDIDESGNALTFVGDDLYLVSGDELWSLDTFSGQATLVNTLALTGFPGPILDYNIVSMTTRPSDNTVFAILRDNSSTLVSLSIRRSFLCAINVSNGAVQHIGQNSTLLDGLAWVPSNYFQPQ